MRNVQIKHVDLSERYLLRHDQVFARAPIVNIIDKARLQTVELAI
jgi:hypothetical protein